MRGFALRRLTVVLLLMASACSREPATGPVDPVWDRTACEHCQMVISDRRHAVQLREAPGLRPHQFDDLGCALLWLGASGIEAKASASGTAVELWVRDREGTAWIDGWQARYETGLHSPMGYGFAAAREGDAAAIAIEAVREQLRALGGKLEMKRRAAGG